MQDIVDDLNVNSSLTEQDGLLAISKLNTFTPEIDKAVNRITGVYASELRNVKKRFEVDEDDKDLTIAISESEVEFVKGELEAVTGQIAGNILFGVLTGTAITANALGNQFLPGRFSRMQAALTTNLSGYRSGMEVRKGTAESDDPRFRYIGPFDSKNRPFCRFVLSQDKEYTLREIRALDRRPDAQLIPTMIYGGGYNCRHRWIFVKD
jgi:hypothetical protein